MVQHTHHTAGARAELIQPPINSAAKAHFLSPRRDKLGAGRCTAPPLTAAHQVDQIVLDRLRRASVLPLALR